jgi:7-cyano-7-deazaguanine synthase in queuosine biosynthesis
MRVVKIADVEIPIIEGNIGLCMSGGADSSLLLYILLANKTETIEVFTIAADLKGRISAKTAANVIDTCIQLTGNNNVNHHVLYTDEQTVEKVFKMPKEMLSVNKINRIYTGITANPPKEIADDFLGAIKNYEHDERNPLVTKSVLLDNFCCPFININKMKIAEIYQTLGLMDTLFSVTRSCELKNPPVNFVDHCDDCWWCKERFWGFKRYI